MDDQGTQPVNRGDRSEPPESSPGRGLPFLPSLVPLMPAQETIFPMDPAVWIKVAENDPTRWSIQISTPSGIPFQFTTIPNDNPVDSGSSCDGTVSFGFKDWGTLVTQAWYIYGRGSTANVTVVECSLRNKRG